MPSVRQIKKAQGSRTLGVINRKYFLTIVKTYKRRIEVDDDALIT